MYLLMLIISDASARRNQHCKYKVANNYVIRLLFIVYSPSYSPGAVAPALVFLKSSRGDGLTFICVVCNSGKFSISIVTQFGHCFACLWSNFRRKATDVWVAGKNDDPKRNSCQMCLFGCGFIKDNNFNFHFALYKLSFLVSHFAYYMSPFLEYMCFHCYMLLSKIYGLTKYWTTVKTWVKKAGVFTSRRVPEHVSKPHVSKHAKCGHCNIIHMVFHNAWSSDEVISLAINDE